MQFSAFSLCWFSFLSSDNPTPWRKTSSLFRTLSPRGHCLLTHLLIAGSFLYAGWLQASIPLSVGLIWALLRQGILFKRLHVFLYCSWCMQCAYYKHVRAFDVCFSRWDAFVAWLPRVPVVCPRRFVVLLQWVGKAYTLLQSNHRHTKPVNSMFRLLDVLL